MHLLLFSVFLWKIADAFKSATCKNSLALGSEIANQSQSLYTQLIRLSKHPTQKPSEKCTRTTNSLSQINKVGVHFDNSDIYNNMYIYNNIFISCL